MFKIVRFKIRLLPSFPEISENQWKQLDETVARPTIPRQARNTGVDCKYLPLSKLPLVYIQPNWLGFAHRRFHSYSRTFRGDTPTTTGWETTISIIDTSRPEIGFSPPRDTCFFETLFSSSSSPPPHPFLPLPRCRNFLAAYFPGGEPIIRGGKISTLNLWTECPFRLSHRVGSNLRFVTFHDDKCSLREIDLFEKDFLKRTSNRWVWSN